MDIDILLVHGGLAATLLLLLSWIGRHSLSAGYMTLSAFVRVDEAPAFNLAFRVIGPIVYITLAASTLYVLKLDRYVSEIWRVAAYYCVARAAYVVLFDRVRLVNWRRELFIWGAMVGGSWVLYDTIISNRDSLLPEVKDLKNQFWILVILFLFAAFNNVRLGSDDTIARKKAYLLDAYSSARAAYGQLISSLVRDDLAESLVYSVLLYEQFNRPRWVQLAERLVFPVFSESLGPMQVKTRLRISDRESVRLGTERLAQIYESALVDGAEKAAAKGGRFDPVGNASHRRYVVYRIASGYNKDDSYLADVQEMHEEVVALRYPALQFPSKHWAEYLF